MESLNKAQEVKSVMESSNESPKTLHPSPSSSSDASKSMCVICLSEIKKEDGKAIFTGECSHSFHFGCITKNVEEGNRICPLCRFQWTQVPTCDVRMLERMNWMVKEFEKKEHGLKNKTHEIEKRMNDLKKKMPEVEKIKREMVNELEKRNKKIHELKTEIHELKKKIEAAEEEEDSGHKESNQGVEAENVIEGGSKKMKKTMVRSSIVTRQKTRELNSK